MRYITPRKAAAGLGAAGPASATAKHWSMTVSAIGMAILTPAFVFVMVTALQLSREGLLLYFSRPYPAIVTGLFLIAGMLHWIAGTRIMIDDYLDHTERKIAIALSHLFGWAVIAAVVYALASMVGQPAVVAPVVVPATVVVN